MDHHRLRLVPVHRAAFGDLGGDGVCSTYERAGAADEFGVNAATGLYIDNELESRPRVASVFMGPTNTPGRGAAHHSTAPRPASPT